jgi:hypothetical protein
MTIGPFAFYRGDAAIALATKMIGQMAMNTITPKAVSSEK